MRVFGYSRVSTAELSAHGDSLEPVAVHEPPMDIPGFELTLLRHRGRLGDPAIAWLDNLVVEALAGGGSE